MARVWPAAVANYDIGILAYQVHKLAFCLVAPMGSDHDYRPHTVTIALSDFAQLS
jgi:hypothetical protein